MRVRVHHLFFLALAVVVSGCSQHSDDLNGTWTGSDIRSDGVTLSDTIVLAGQDNTISGTFTATLNGAVAYAGTISGTFNKPSYTFAATIPTGSVTGDPNCAISISGTATFVASSGTQTSPTKTLSGSFKATPLANCASPGVTTDTFTWTMPG